MATQMNGNFLLPYGEVWAYSSIILSVVVLSVNLPLSYLCLPYFPRLVLKVVTFYGDFTLLTQ